MARDLDRSGTALPETDLDAIGKDKGPFHRLGGSFLIPGGNLLAQNSMFAKGMQFSGAAVASPVALYLVKAERNRPAYKRTAKRIYELAGREDPMCTCHVQDLPTAVRAGVDPRGLWGGEEVVVVLKSSVSFVRSVFLDNTVAFKVGADNFTVLTAWFCDGKVRRMLRELGWELNAKLTPTAAGIHNLQNRGAG